MAATFRIDDSQSNAYARFPVQNIQKIITFDSSNFAVPQLIAEGNTTVLGSRVGKIMISTNDTLDNQIQFYLHDGSNIAALPFAFDGIPALTGSGLDTSKFATNCLRSTGFEQIVDLDNNGNPFFMLQVGYSIYAKINTQISALKTIQVTTWLDDY